MPKWLNRNTTSLGLVSFFNDFSHEMAKSIIPAFIISIGGSAISLGIIEGISQIAISIVKLVSGWYSDILGKRKIFAVIGYVLTTAGIFLYSLATNWYHVLIGNVVAVFGKGVREPARDALLVKSSQPQYYSKIFGFNRSMDTLGAIVGPLLALILLNYVPLRTIFYFSLIPGIFTIITLVFFVKDIELGKITERKNLLQSLNLLPNNFKIFLTAVGISSLGNFAISILVLRSIDIISPIKGTFTADSLSIIFFMFYSIIYSLLSLPIGYLADKIGKKNILVIGYFFAGITAIGASFNVPNIFYISILFIIAGISIAAKDTLERAMSADFLPEDLKGTGYGALALVNGICAFFANIFVGFLWHNYNPLLGFGFAAIFSILGSVFLFAKIKSNNKNPAQNTI